MSSSLQRSRSLRKPNPPTSTTTSSSSSNLPPRTADVEQPRHGSPSRLPVKPLARSSSVSTGSNPTRVLRSAAGVGPAASSGLGRSASVRQPAHGPAAAAEGPRKETSRYPPTTTTTTTRPRARTAAAPLPPSSDGPAAIPRRAPTHTRAKSTTTTLKAAPVLRPPSQGPSISTTRLRTAQPTTTTSAEETPAAPSQQQQQQQQQQQPPAHPRLRPAFSTLQQHYSPARSLAPKPLTSTYLAPPSPSKLPANVAASAETSRLQTELLQLHLLHRDAARVDAEWRASAEDRLGGRFAQLAAASRDVDERERAERQRHNVLALRAWAAGGGGGGGLEERIQTLDGIVSGLWTLGEAAGRYARVVRRFERWVDRMCEVEDARKTGGDLLLLPGRQAVLFIGELDAAWKDECEGLRRRLDGWKGQLGEWEPVPDDEADEPSSLARMVEGARIAVDDMLAELNLMEAIEREALVREDEWIGRMNRVDADDDTPRAGAIWRVV